MGVIFASFVLYKGYSIIQQNGEYKSVIATQNETIKNQTDTIEKLKVDVILRENIIAARDVQVEQLRQDLDGLTDDLGEGSDDLAPQSLREVLRRLNR